MVFAGLFIILIIVLCAPFLVKKVEEELEIFLFCMGCIAVTITAQWDIHLLKEALLEPVKITAAVLAAGVVFNLLQKPLAHNVNRAARRTGIKLFSALVIILLGLLSSFITAIIAALVLVEIISCLNLPRKDEIVLVVLSCFSIGLGAALTPLGEPLSTIVIAKLRGEPYNAGFFFLCRHLLYYILPGIAACAALGMLWMPAPPHKGHGLVSRQKEKTRDIFIRTGKVYLFVMALIFLGKGFKPIIDAYISKIPYQGLYWLNMISAILDNATLAAAEIGPSMGILQIKSALLGLLIAGGMLIPGNIPNIISAGKLKIKSSEWARIGVPLGLVLMTAYFLALILIRA